MKDEQTQRIVDAFYNVHGPCCAGCDWLTDSEGSEEDPKDIIIKGIIEKLSGSIATTNLVVSVVERSHKNPEWISVKEKMPEGIASRLLIRERILIKCAVKPRRSGRGYKARF